MAQESCDLNKDGGILKPLSSSSPSPSPATTAPPQTTQIPEPPPQQSAPPTQPTPAATAQFMSSPCVEIPIEASKKRKPVAADATDNETLSVVVQAEPLSPVLFVNRCEVCRKRVSLTGFRCRCGHLFCSRHRHSETHNCSFDYKTARKEEIAHANPVIKAAKIIKI